MALGSASNRLWSFPYISKLPNILSLMSISNSRGNKYKKFVSIEIKPHFPIVFRTNNVNQLFHSPEVLSSTCDKAKLFAENFSQNSNLDDSGISLPVFPSWTNLKLHNISVHPKMVKKVIANLDFWKASVPDCIPVVVLKNCEPELSHISAESFNTWLEEPCFPGCWKVPLVFCVLKNVRQSTTAKNYHPVSLLSVVSKVFQKLVDNRIVDHLEKSGLFLISGMF